LTADAIEEGGVVDDDTAGEGASDSDGAAVDGGVAV